MKKALVFLIPFISSFACCASDMVLAFALGAAAGHLATSTSTARSLPSDSSKTLAISDLPQVNVPPTSSFSTEKVNAAVIVACAHVAHEVCSILSSGSTVIEPDALVAATLEGLQQAHLSQPIQEDQDLKELFKHLGADKQPCENALAQIKNQQLASALSEK